MTKSWIPRILRPDYTWQRPMQPNPSVTTPPMPRIPSYTSQIIWGWIHSALARFSRRYCSWFGIPCHPLLLELPFGLVFKWKDTSSLEEAVAMQLARKAGFPVPKVISFGVHPGNYLPSSILMTRLPGVHLRPSRRGLRVHREGPWITELKKCLDAMRQWKGPEKRICSAIVTPIRSPRVPFGTMGPFENQADLNKYLLSTASACNFSKTKDYENFLQRAEQIKQRHHRTTFTQGDFRSHNILIDRDGHLTGILDWESAGWCPEYWEFTTVLLDKNPWWNQLMEWLGGNQYKDELDSDLAVSALTASSFLART